MRIERLFYIPPDITVNSDGTVEQDDWVNVLRLGDDHDSFLLGEDGFGMPGLDYLTQQGPQQHGETILDYRLEPRVVQVTARWNGCSREAYWEHRAAVLNLLRPNRQAAGEFAMGRLRRILADGSVRDLYALIEQGPDFSVSTGRRWDERAFTETLRFACPDPLWFDPALQSANWVLTLFNGLLFWSATNSDHLTFPLNAIFSSDVISDSLTVTYAGTFMAYPTIVITGPVTSPRIENETLGLLVQMNYTVKGGEVVTITTGYGNKTVTNNLGENLIGTLSDDSDLDIHVGAHPEAPGGVNVFTAEGSNANAGPTAISLTYHTRYIAI